jgi:anti-sigma factor RsiW
MSDGHLSVYLLDDPETGEEERRAIERHLAACGDCRKSLESFRRARRLLQSPLTAANDDRFVGRILSRVEAGPAGISRPARRWLPASLLGVLIALAAGISYLLNSPETTTQDLLAAGEEGVFYEWATASGTPSEDEVLAFVLDEEDL